MRWSEFEVACPEIADLARERSEKDQIVLVGTIRRDGSPRISPESEDFAVDRLSSR
jgi:hypothetical protein